MKKKFKVRTGYTDRIASGLMWSIYDRHIELGDDGRAKLFSVIVRSHGCLPDGKPTDELDGRIVKTGPPNSQGDREYRIEFEDSIRRIAVEAIELGTGELVCTFTTSYKRTESSDTISSGELFIREK
ncbi:MAG: hypothetical protein ACOYOU_11120 [Kiritimatiellia bacterium]